MAGGALARSWLKLKVKIDKPAVGGVVVFWRGYKNGGSGPVSIVVAQDQHGNLMVFGDDLHT